MGRLGIAIPCYFNGYADQARGRHAPGKMEMADAIRLRCARLMKVEAGHER